ncbi:zinc finger protein [Plectosphaerella plurivora]|uniref:RING-type E3 ubiquitin transferase n=1 Tax=Plectosphaerella plurivora TaxID=936078 RepID=A0A9P9A8P8_9PEZI|nr:zinc finger protein [Plectosphaerella plurivora]
MAPDETNSTRSNRGRGRGRGDGSRGNASRGRGQRPRGRGNDTPRAGAAEPAANAPTQGDAPPPTVEGKAPEGVPATAEGDEVCFICADPIKFHSVAPCNHKTCHICGLRMRALYKTKDCPHCRTAAPFVVFTEDPLKRFEDYTEVDITSLDHNIGIKYASEDIVGDTVVLLRYNCPVDDCVFAGLGWPDLHRHVRSVHQRKMCDLCTRNKKVFTHEHELFTDKELEKHMRRGDDQPGALDQTGFKGHPLCGFCGSRFYDDDRLYDHCREKHERCFLCDRRDSRHPHYYVNYEALEKHFTTDHFPCLDRECQERKFVVFESEIDLKAHQLSEHGNTLSKDVRRDARMVDLSDFDYRQTYQPERRGGGAGGSRGGRDGGRAGRGRGRDPNAEPIPQSSAQPMRRDELAFQRQLAIHSAQSVTNRTFGGQLSAPTASPTPAQAAAAAAAVRPSNAPRATAQAPTPGAASAEVATADSANATPADRARNLRHAAVIERASNLLGQDAVKLAKFRDHISAYRAGKLKAPQLIDAFFALFSETSSNALGTLVREVADLFEDRGKAQAIQTAWQDWRAINEDYPSLPGLGGMEGATTSSSGWANAATPSIGAPAASANQKQASRVLRLKSSTRRQSASSSSSAGPGPGPGPSQSTASSLNWAATVPATSTRPPPSSAFPALSAPAAGSSSGPSRPSWIGPNNHGQSGSGRPSRAVAGNKEDNFPALPMAPKPLTTIFGYGNGRGVRRDFGVSRDTGFSWGGGSAGDSGNPSEKEEEVEEPTGGKKKKGNKGKKVLVQWG